jgi:two-component system sensor histidine kinase SenX3
VTALAVLLAVALVASTAAALHFRRLATRSPAPDGPADVAATAAETATPPVDESPAAPDEDRLLLERFRAVIDQLQRAVVLWDGQGRELYRNAAARAMFEARDGHVLVAAAIEEVLPEALAGRSVRREVELFGPPAASFVVVARPFGVVLDGPDGETPTVVDGALAMVEDRSMQRRTETVRRDFVANISHELKTPIGALGLLAETLREETSPAVVERLAERMIAEADRVGRTVDDLLELSSIEFGDDTEFEDLDVRSLVGEAEARLGPAADQAGIKIRVDVPGDLVLHGDRRQLVSALFNLLDNAVKYSPEDSEIVVGAVVAGEGELDPPGTVRLSVADEGIGVPRRDLDRIFERFYRVDRARSRRTGGTGLGLAIVRHVASNHGGEVRVESTEGVGSVFTLVLPRRPERQEDE